MLGCESAPRVNEGERGEGRGLSESSEGHVCGSLASEMSRGLVRVTACTRPTVSPTPCSYAVDSRVSLASFTRPQTPPQAGSLTHLPSVAPTQLRENFSSQAPCLLTISRVDGSVQLESVAIHYSEPWLIERPPRSASRVSSGTPTHAQTALPTGDAYAGGLMMGRHEH